MSNTKPQEKRCSHSGDKTIFNPQFCEKCGEDFIYAPMKESVFILNVGEVFTEEKSDKLMEYLQQFLATALEEQRLGYVEKVKEFKVLLHINEPRGDNVGVDEKWGIAYNEAIEDVLAILNGKETKCPTKH